ncbi:MAG TPA: adenylate/guanylate cyclase domain-containing protein [Vineibacter sp.]|nr:adenylate/guanylate cyclase domain-containing protein [Vineibacter sp.]
MNERRRLAAIVAADVAGYSRLMGRDESGTLSALKARRVALIDPLITEHHGRIVKTTGDGLLLEFSSVVDSARCAVALQEGMARLNADVAADHRLELRVGINVGDVIVDGDDIFGDGVNVAARLEQTASPGGICLSDRAYQEVRGRIEAAFVDGGRRELKNISEPVQVWMWSGTASAPPLRDGGAAAKSSEQASIAVLPFSVLSEDPGVGFLADGLAEDVTALLARMPGFFVVSRSSSFAFRDRAADVPRIARQLGVRYIVEGSLRDASGAMRVAIQLTDAATGRVLWSRRFEAQRSATLDLQDEIARNIIAEIEPELTRAEIAVIRRQRPENVDAWGFYRQAVGAIALKGWREEAVAEARQHLQRALGLDDNFGLAHAQFAVLTAVAQSVGLLDGSEAVRLSAETAAESAIALDEGSSEVLGYAGCAFSDLGQHRRSIEILEQAVEIDPSNAQAHVALGAAMTVAGQREAGISTMRHGIRLSPRDQRLAFWRWALGNALLRTGRFDEALEEARAAGRIDPRLHLARLLEAVALAARGEEAPAHAALAAARKLRPRLTLEEVAQSHGRFGAKQVNRLWQAG